MTATKQFLFEHVLLPEGWAENVLVSVDDSGNFESLSWDKVIEKSVPGCHRISGWVIPGIPNCHSHAHQRAMAGLGEKAGLNDTGTEKATDSFWTWRTAMYHYLERIQPHHLYAISQQLYLEMLKAGYTNVGEFQYLHHDPQGNPYSNPAEMTSQCMQGALNLGLGFTALPVLYRYGGFGSQQSTDGQKRFLNDSGQFCQIVESLFTEIKQSGNQNSSVGIAPHSLRAVSQTLLSDVIENLGSDRLAAIHLHIAEQTKEVDDCIEWCGQRPMEWLLERFDINPQWCLIHATHMTEQETREMATSGAVAGLCPTTEANLGDGFFNMEAYCSDNGNWAIGSDSHISISPVEELRWLEYGLRLQNRQRNILASLENQSTGMTLLQGALNGGEISSGRKIGRIQTGYRCDFVVLDPDHPRLMGRADDQLIDSWIFSGNESPVRDVYVGGDQIIDGGHHLIEETVEQEYKRVIMELTNL